MNLKVLLLTNNACYKSGKTIKVKGIMVHSTGANNPTLKRYVGPDDGLLGKNQYNNHWNQDKPDGRQVCVHAFIGKLADGSIATYQTLPWDMRGWHGGSGKNGSVNDTHIGFEICEDALTDAAYFGKVYQEAVELCAMLCKTYDINPLQKDKSGGIICHSEGNALGIASNHADVMHWFPKHGKSMDTFRADVKKAMEGAVTPQPEPTHAPTTDNEAVIWNFLKGKGLNDFAVAGVMGNLYAESGLKPTNLQNSYETKLGYTDATYTAAVDNGSYSNFKSDSAGYGLAQWTYSTRKENLLQYAQKTGKSIGDLQMQLDFMWSEMQGYSAMMKTLKAATSVLEASNAFLTQYEKPADQSEAVQTKRAGYGQTYYSKYADKTPAPEPTPASQMYRVRKTWADSKTQVGAYTVLENAKKHADESKALGYKVFDAAGNIVYDPATGETTPTLTPEEITVDNALADGIITDRTHWLGVLVGTIAPNKANIKTLMDNAHVALSK